MSMTREEAINWIADLCDRYSKQAEEYEKQGALIPMDAMYPYIQALGVALAALRPVSREQVERCFPGCDFCKIELDDYPYIVAHSDYSSSDTCYEPSFCPICGKPLTDEAVQMVMERLEALKDGNSTD